MSLEKKLKIWKITGIVLYPIGIICVFLMILFLEKDVLMSVGEIFAIIVCSIVSFLLYLIKGKKPYYMGTGTVIALFVICGTLYDKHGLEADMFIYLLISLMVCLPFIASVVALSVNYKISQLKEEKKLR